MEHIPSETYQREYFQNIPYRTCNKIHSDNSAETQD
jgi:hypothetical protein